MDLKSPQICNFGQGSACDSPKMEASCEFDKSSLQQVPWKSVGRHIRLDFDPKKFRYSEVSK